MCVLHMPQFESVIIVWCKPLSAIPFKPRGHSIRIDDCDPQSCPVHGYIIVHKWERRQTVLLECHAFMLSYAGDSCVLEMLCGLQGWVER